MFYLIVGDKCQWCDKAKELLNEKGLGFTAHSYKEHDMILPLMIKADLRTVPQIWKQGGDYIGGYEDLKAYLESESQ